MAFQPHKFKAVTITTPAACKYCHEVISWGIPRPGFVCTGTNNGRRYGAHFSLARSLTEAVDLWGPRSYRRCISMPVLRAQEVRPAGYAGLRSGCATRPAPRYAR